MVVCHRSSRNLIQKTTTGGSEMRSRPQGLAEPGLEPGLPSLGLDLTLRNGHFLETSSRNTRWAARPAPHPSLMSPEHGGKPLRCCLPQWKLSPFPHPLWLTGSCESGQRCHLSLARSLFSLAFRADAPVHGPQPGVGKTNLYPSGDQHGFFWVGISGLLLSVISQTRSHFQDIGQILPTPPGRAEEGSRLIAAGQEKVYSFPIT